MTPAKEAAFETVIETHLLANGYIAVNRDGLDLQRAFLPETVLAFMRATQSRGWARLEATHGDKTGEQILSDLCKCRDTYDVLATLRHGFKCYGRTPHAGPFRRGHRSRLHDRAAGRRVDLLPTPQQRVPRGAGDPPDTTARAYRTAYLWEEVLQ